MGKVYIFDNHTGIDIPEMINDTPVEILFGESLFKIKDNIDGTAELFCVFTKLKESDIIVQSELDKRFIDAILEFAEIKYDVDIKESSIWYSESAKKNIIFSDSVNLDSFKLGTLIETYLGKVKEYEKSTPKQEKNEMYIVTHVRNGKELFRTPTFDEAKKICDKNPCSVIINRECETVYESRYGRLSIPYTKTMHTFQHRSKLSQLNRGPNIRIQ